MSTHVVNKLKNRRVACAPAGARALALIDQFKEQELSNVVWAFAKLHHYEQGLFAHLLAAVKAKLHHFLPQVGNIAEDVLRRDACACASCASPLNDCLQPYDRCCAGVLSRI
jgi:hypothetical protein